MGGKVKAEPFDVSIGSSKVLSFTLPAKRKVDEDAERDKERERDGKRPRKASSKALGIATPVIASSSAHPTLGLAPSSQKSRVILKLPAPRAPGEDEYPCCLCVGTQKDGLCRVHDAPREEVVGAALEFRNGIGKVWRAHESCAEVVPETWVDDIEVPRPDGQGTMMERVVFGVDGIVRDRWNLVGALHPLYQLLERDLTFFVEMFRLHEITGQRARGANPVYQGQM